ncbi:hypothetical protein H5399_09170 [Tessaracoccus sp. MC1627]|uniref:YobI family P-loop NTPase n=1 Tax=Tessaracoccus sp. MC1627 TaxID=2760312 RepID=UPI0016016BEE|nr:P-loop NTPase fold protein [Tessaracoccus sp. MC1627]MBB1512771.1 hypothetical protein [Tessaracoccus sp. MC1627]
MLLLSQADPAANTTDPDLLPQPADPYDAGVRSDLKLRSLAPKYEQGQHETYVRHLESAVLDPKNRNIALTGRYGSGKSSILDKFLAGQDEKKQTTLRISINTLGPDGDEELTNRIQKELVKQLVYRADSGQVKRSRFARGKELTWLTSLRDAVVVSTILCGLLWLFGVRPKADAFGSLDPALSVVAFVLLVVAAAWAARWVVGTRLVSQVSTGGTSISFANQPDSYFDEYLDELVAFFEATRPDVVVFEDLDRFDDPRIFDSLRELNTLINASAAWKDRTHPLRFVYAIKDSLFEKLGSKPHPEAPVKDSVSETSTDGVAPAVTAASQGAATPAGPTAAAPAGTAGPAGAAQSVSWRRRDAADIAVERANRTKFFEVVIPVVPFLSHNNARDLLSTALAELNVPAETKISRSLLDLVARHVTDMRLMINICNEFAVFAERLLWIPTKDRAPGMTADNLFAIVVYKNFHLADFERLPHRASDLDALEQARQRLVRDSITQLQRERRDLAQGEKHQEQQEGLARVLGERLRTLLTSTRSSIRSITVGNHPFTDAATNQASFWRAVAENRSVSVALALASGHSGHLSFAELSVLCAECTEPLRWRDQTAEEVAEQRSVIDTAVAWLRGASFQDLVQDPSFEADGKSFGQHLASILKSELARDLVRHGFVDRYYAEYSAAFYGNFLGVDVANFFRNSVWPNEMDVNARFTTTDAVHNILEQAPAGFASSRSVLNIQVVDYLLEYLPALAEEVAAFIAADHGEDARTFLDAYLNDTTALKPKLIEALARRPWRGVLNHLALPEAVSDEDARTKLLDAALLAAHDAKEYALTDAACALIVERHASLAAFTQEHAAARVAVVLSFARRLELSVPLLAPLSHDVRTALVKEGAYALTLANLRTALDLDETTTPTLDRIRLDDYVWLRCRDEIDTYLDAVASDSQMKWAVHTAPALSQVVSEQAVDWSRAQILSLLTLSRPEAAVPDITAVAQAAWSAIAEAQRLVPNAANLHAYSQAFGVDAHLAKILVSETGQLAEVSGVEEAPAESIRRLTVTILNASSVLGAGDRVQLALQLNPQRPPESLAATEIQPSGDDLLAYALKSELLPDTADTFTHFLTGGWASVSAAFKVSTAAKDFLTPSLVAGHVRELLVDPYVPDALKVQVVQDLGSYVIAGDGETLLAAVAFAHTKQIRLDAAHVLAAAPHATDPEHILWQLALGRERCGEDIMRVLGQLGDDYEGFNREPGYEFDVPLTHSTRSVLDRLKSEKLVDLPRGGRNSRKKVRIL